jgi:hypothetical protein
MYELRAEFGGFGGGSVMYRVNAPACPLPGLQHDNAQSSLQQFTSRREACDTGADNNHFRAFHAALTLRNGQARFLTVTC